MPSGAIPQQREESAPLATHPRRGPVTAAVIGVIVLVIAGVAVAATVTRGGHAPAVTQPVALPSAPAPGYLELPEYSPFKQLRREFSAPVARRPGNLSPVRNPGGVPTS